MISGKFLGRRGGTTANAIKAVNYFTDLKVRHGLNIVATNNSWGGGGFSQALLDAIVDGANAEHPVHRRGRQRRRDGVGDNNDSIASYPCNYDTTAGAGWDAVIAVAAITSTGARPRSRTTARPPSTSARRVRHRLDDGRQQLRVVQRHVDGDAARDRRCGAVCVDPPWCDAAPIKAAILTAAMPTASLSGRDVTNGRLNVSGF